MTGRGTGPAARVGGGDCLSSGDRKQAEERSGSQTALLAGIARIYQETLTSETEEALGRVCLAVAGDVTQSKFGFIGEINSQTGMLNDLAISAPGWAASESQGPPGRTRKVPINFKIHGIYGRVVLDGKGFFTNDPSSHPDSIGTPPGHPPLTSFLGVPLVQAGKVIGMLALGNREGGYGPEELEAAEALAPTVVQAFQHQRAQAALQESEGRFRSLVDSVPQLAWTAQPDGYITWYNRQWYEYTGTTSQQMEGWGWQVVHDPATLPDVLLRWKASIATGTAFDMEFPLRGAGGKFRRFLTRVVPLKNADGAVVQWFGTNTDVTELVEAQESLRESDRRKTEFLAVLSHELRNPLAPIRNSIYLLERAAPGSGQAARAKEVLQRQTEHLTRLVDDLLDVTRISRGKIDLQRTRVDVRDIVRQNCDDLHSLFEQGGIEMRLDLPSAPLWVDADAARISQAAGNLLQNAAKFTPPGGRVLVEVAGRDGRAEITVRDTGIGIEPGDLDRMFEPFAQADQGLARTQGGLGLGLALAKGLVELHGGSLRGRSQGKESGSEFMVSLPLAPPSEPLPAISRGSGAATGRVVLLIEDNVDAAQSLAEILELQGHDVRLASDGKTGIRMARELKPDVVLCDIGLPDVDGYAVARALRADDSLRSTRLIALSGYAQPEDKVRAREAGFDAHVAKPAVLDELTKVIASDG